MQIYFMRDKLFEGIKIPDKLTKRFKEAIPSKRYSLLVDIFQDVISGYTAASYDILLAIEDAFTQNGLKEGQDRKEIKKNRDIFLRQMKKYITQRIKMDLQI
jgi:ABC-type branched-subunit amino acid transport system substrate-binding protein